MENILRYRSGIGLRYFLTRDYVENEHGSILFQIYAFSFQEKEKQSTATSTLK